ncbi:hypothetical protein JCM8097_008800 [Rhodosporidiobolus ruineniae]
MADSAAAATPATAPLSAPRSSTTPPPRRRRPLSALSILVLSLVFHACYFPALFDIYFRSPVVAVDDRHRVEQGGLAKRVVLIVGDGLRADKLFQTYSNPPFDPSSSQPLPEPLENLPHSVLSTSELALLSSSDTDAPGEEERTTPAPFLRGLIQSGKAQWGVSHTRVPTESRPGHVALIGGMYEDVSAVTRGWTTNPVPFDSVFNQSSHAYTFGSPDILPMFQLGASDPTRVSAWSYTHEDEDFTSDAVHLDLWVLEQLKELLSRAETDEKLDQELRQDGVVFFEHLLGLDTTGHSYRPHGPEYHRNIRVVDYVVRETTELLREFYGDDETAFVFTADHGMSSLGNHGDGHPDNTRTPLVVWGKGVREREDWEEPAGQDEYSMGWGLKGVRRDVEQADVAPLLSVLAGIPLPANSAGRVPLDYLNASPSFRAHAALANAKQLLAEAEAKSEEKRSHTLGFRPFPELVQDPPAGTQSAAKHVHDLEELLEKGEFAEVEKRSVELGEVALRASLYVQKYDWLLLRSVVTAGYVGFITFVALSILRSQSPSSASPRSSTAARLSTLQYAILALSALLSLRFWAETAPLSYYLYAAFPAYFWTSVVRDLDPVLDLFRPSSPSSSPILSSSPLLSLLFPLVPTLAALLYTALGYTNRRFFAAIAFAMGWAWPMLGFEAAYLGPQRGRFALFSAAMSALAVFPVLPVEKGEDLWQIAAGAAALVSLAIAYLWFGDRSSPTWSRTRSFINAEILLTLFTLRVTWSSATSLQAKRGLPTWNQWMGWLILVSSIALPLFHGRPHAQPSSERLAVLLLALSPAFILLSLSYEALFYAVYLAALGSWTSLEGALAREREGEAKKREVEAGGKGTAVGEREGRLELEHVRIALFFLAFLHLGFFGCGNVASISSFYLEPVYRLMTVFAPFPMGALLLFKLLIPFVALAAVSSVINRQLRLPPLSLFLIGSVLSDILTIFFFFRVTDTGSWLEIGSSITNYAISSLLGIFSSVLLAGGEWLLAGTV